MSAFLAIAGADAKERTRRFAFLLTIVAALYGGYLYVPAPGAPYVTLVVDHYRGIYNSAWLGALTAVMSSAFLSLIGFYLVRGAVQRDRELDVDGIVAATTVSKTTYLFGKFLSNLGVLAMVAAIMFVACVMMQLLRGEDAHIGLRGYALPFLFITLPGLAIVAALAILFDSIRWLRGTLGSVAYFFLWTALLTIPLLLSHGGTIAIPFDPFGMSILTAQIAQSALHVFPNADLHNLNIGASEAPPGMATFVFAGIQWSAGLVAERFAWLLCSLLLILAAIPFFDRFRFEERARATAGRRFDISAIVPNVPGLRLYRAELALLLNGSSVWWLLGGVAIAAIAAFLPLNIVTNFVLPVAAIWPIERWSALGARERRWNVADIIASAPHPNLRPLIAQWAAASSLGLVLFSGYIVRLLVTGDAVGALGCALALCAIAAAAIACGTLAGSPRLFEAAYLLVWYLGPVNHLAPADFIGATLLAPGRLTLIASIVAITSIALAFAGRITARMR